MQQQTMELQQQSVVHVLAYMQLAKHYTMSHTFSSATAQFTLARTPQVQWPSYTQSMVQTPQLLQPSCGAYVQVGHPVNGTDIIPAFDHSVEILGDKAILVYPQSTGDPGTGAADEGQGKKYRQVGVRSTPGMMTGPSQAEYRV